MICILLSRVQLTTIYFFRVATNQEKHGKNGRLQEFEKLSKSQGELRKNSGKFEFL